MTITYDCTEETGREVGLSSASGALRAGRLVVTPTDTLYGIAADAFDPDAVNLLLSAKRRGPDMPVPVLVGSWETIDGLVVSTPAAARDLIRAFWPGGLSLIVHQAPSLGWNLGHTQGTVMLRMPLHPVAIELLRDVGPLAVSSANVSGQPPATTVAQAREQLGESVAVYLDGGPCAVGLPSTIVDLTGPGPVIVREGAVTSERVGEVLDIDPAQLRA
ncbi:MAG TPA: threonylcarbamoyl-AMP synthase [Candidatus Dietzia merdigallinarum]|nr:threonylcarbamoyl-AMP synthase [Candidatus Dietzia merdigallinarum]HJD79391.1 threonylcarbamoyl-AMP synthase [Corynebacterium pollutisoli]